MADELLTVLSADAEASEKNAPAVDDRVLTDLHETLLLAQEVDLRVGELQAAGRVGLWVPAGEAAAPAAGIAAALEPADWLYPSFRDWAAYLLRGGSLRHLVAQVMATEADPLSGRQLPGQVSLDAGRYVAPSAAAGAAVLRAAGTALAMRLGDTGTVAVASCGAGAVEQADFWMALQNTARHRAPLIVVCRTPSTGEIEPARRAKAVGLAVDRVDGADVLAVMKATRAARERAVETSEGTLLEVVVEATDQAASEPLRRLQPFLEHRGLSDPGRAAEVAERCRERLNEALETARADRPAPLERLFDDVTAERSWMLQEQRERLLDS